jgi:hypothetical protein
MAAALSAQSSTYGRLLSNSSTKLRVCVGGEGGRVVMVAHLVSIPWLVLQLSSSGDVAQMW